jgi:hypothetical protein
VFADVKLNLSLYFLIPQASSEEMFDRMTDMFYITFITGAPDDVFKARAEKLITRTSAPLKRRVREISSAGLSIKIFGRITRTTVVRSRTTRFAKGLLQSQ